MKKIYPYLFFLLPLLQACDEGGLLIEPDISDQTVTLIAPLDNTEVASNVVFLYWEPVVDATTYQVQVATPDFTNTAQLLYNAEDSVTVAELELPIGDYEWRVRARNSGYETAYSNARFKVVAVEDFSDNLVLLSSPEDNLVTNVPQQGLTWVPVDGATLYRIQLLQDGSTVQEQTSTGTDITLTFPEGESLWQVRAENGQENTLYSSRNLLLDTEGPNTPELTAPEDGEELTTGTVSLEWTREALEGSAELDSVYVYRDLQLTDLAVKDRGQSPYEIVLENGTYYWLVKGFDGAGNQGNASDTFSFTVNEQP